MTILESRAPDMPTAPHTMAFRMRQWLYDHRWYICLFLAALVVRLHWNCIAHPIGAFNYSDMHGYTSRADRVLSAPFEKREYEAFFPYGTAWIIAGIKYLFGRENSEAIGTVYAVMGSSIVVFAYATTKRITSIEWVAPFVGFLLVFYYPLISIGGYTLSELPYSFFFCASLLLLMRLVDLGRSSDALLLGLCLGIGTVVRPQILLGVGLVGLFWIAFRKYYPRITLVKLVLVGIPLLMCLGYSAVRLHHHTGRWGLVSENGPLNLMFGRCHAKGVHAKNTKGGSVRFAPPPLIQLEGHSKRHPDSWLQMNPVLGDYPQPIAVPQFIIDGRACAKNGCRIPGAEVEYLGYIGDKNIQNTITRECIRRSGIARQIYYGFVHIVQLWDMNLMWPDSASPKPRSEDRRWRWRALQSRWRLFHNIAILGPSLLGLVFIVRPKRSPKSALLALNILAMLLVAAIYFGDPRLRAPHDPLLIIVASQIYIIFGIWIVRKWQKIKRRFEFKQKSYSK